MSVDYEQTFIFVPRLVRWEGGASLVLKKDGRSCSLGRDLILQPFSTAIVIDSPVLIKYYPR